MGKAKVAPEKGGAGKKGAAGGGEKGKKASTWDDKAAKMDQMKENLTKSIANRRGSVVQIKAKRRARRKAGRGKTFMKLAWERVFGSREVIKLNRKSKEMVSALMLTEEEIREMKRVFDEVDLDG